MLKFVKVSHLEIKTLLFLFAENGSHFHPKVAHLTDQENNLNDLH